MIIECSPNQVEVSFYEQHNTPNIITVKRGEMTKNAVRSLAYTLLKMIGE